MKIFYLAIFATFFPMGIYAQRADARLLNYMTDEEIAEISKENPKELQLISYALDHGLYVANYEPGKGPLPVIEVDADKLPNYLDLGLAIADQNQYFRISGRNKVLVMKSRWVLNYELSKQ